jgi:hypothetical protein
MHRDRHVGFVAVSRLSTVISSMEMPQIMSQVNIDDFKADPPRSYRSQSECLAALESE